MKKNLRLLSLLLMLFMIGGACDEDCDSIFIDSDCGCDFRQRPVEGILTVEVRWDGNTPVRIDIYEGDFEDDVWVLSDTLSVEVVDYLLPIGEYSGVARYAVGRDSIFAVDGDEIKVEEDDESCCDCYRLEDATLDLRLRTQ